ncbi:hypothetical protein M0805_009274 [Coniferiporia weirii]|nr:hypothetical protein M0805_009274 [Coniferiporia weirii]
MPRTPLDQPKLAAGSDCSQYELHRQECLVTSKGGCVSCRKFGRRCSLVANAPAPGVVFGPYSPISPDGPTTISVYSSTDSSQLSLPLDPPSPSHVDELSEQQQSCTSDEEVDADSDSIWEFMYPNGSTKVGSENENTSDGEESDQMCIVSGVEGNVRIVIEAPLEDSKDASYDIDDARPVASALGPDSARLMMSQSVATSTSDVRSQPITQNNLQKFLERIGHLNLAGKIWDISPVMKTHGGYSDIFTGYCSVSQSHGNGKMKVAVKRLRVHTMGDKKVQKQLVKEL